MLKDVKVPQGVSQKHGSHWLKVHAFSCSRCMHLIAF